MTPRIKSRRTLLAVGLAVAAAVLAAQRTSAAITWMVAFSIADEPGLQAGSDGLGSYEDFRLETSPGINQCIEAALEPTGGLHAVFNRKIDSIGTRCNPNGSDRQFTVTISGAGACARIASAYNPVGNAMGKIPVVNPDGSEYTPGQETCALVYNDNPRVRVSKLFTKSNRTPVAFLTVMYNTDTSYEIQTETDAMVVSVDGDTREVVSNGTGRLWEFLPGQRAKAVEAAFPLSFRIVFTRTPL